MSDVDCEFAKALSFSEVGLSRFCCLPPLPPQ